jgi:hypothetical protein
MQHPVNQAAPWQPESPASEQTPQCHPINSIYIRHSTVRNYWLIEENPDVIDE